MALPLTASEEVLRITGPLTDTGRIDFLKAWEEYAYPPELATDDNGFRTFFRQFGDAGRDEYLPHRESCRLHTYKKLGLDPDVPPTLVFPKSPLRIIEDFHEEKENKLSRDQLRSIEKTITEHPWTLEQFPMLADWINEIDEPLDAIAESIRKPIFFIPLLEIPESVQSDDPQCFVHILKPDIELFRAVARMFCVRATYRLGKGDIDGAIDDILTTFRLGRQITQKSGRRHYLVGLAIENLARAVPVGQSSKSPITAKQIQRILDGLDLLPQPASFHYVRDWERFNALSTIQGLHIAADRKDEKLFAEIFSLYTAGMDPPPWIYHAATERLFNWNWNVLYQRMNEIHDDMQTPLAQEKFRAMETTFMPGTVQWSFALARMTSGGMERMTTNLLAVIAYPPLFHGSYAMDEASRRAKCSENMQRLALALLLSRLENGTMPE